MTVWGLWCAVLLLPMQTEPAVSFQTEILPLLTKAGCNSGACHGAAAGRGGLRLSLFAADSRADYESIVLALEGRRINLKTPSASLFLRKPAGYVHHGGGVIFAEDSDEASLLLRWIQQGVPFGESVDVRELQVQPSLHVCTKIPETIALGATAIFGNGDSADVISKVRISIADEQAVTLNADGTVTVQRPGQHVVLVRFLNRVMPIRIHAPYLSQAAVGPAATDEPLGPIDRHLRQVSQEMRLPLSPPASEDEWFRRVSLDLTGRLPTPEEVRGFLDDKSPDKRAQKIDQLMAGSAFVDLWTLRFSRLLRLQSLPGDQQLFEAAVSMVREVIARDGSLDELARQLLTATGDSHENGAASWSRMVPDARVHAERIGEVFVGARLGCANCHNHPLDRWTQDDYHGLAAVFARLDRSRVVQLRERGAVTNPRTGEPAVPRIPGVGDLGSDGDQRVAIADWVLAEPELRFARVTVNRLWKFMFGRGLVEPVDDLRDTNPATHPELLTWLAQDFAKHGYRIRHTLKQMVLSRAWGASSQPVPGNEQDDRFYSRYYRRSLSPEVLLDAIADVTAVPGAFSAHQTALAVQVLDPARPAGSLDLLGRCIPGRGCIGESGRTAGLPAKLHLLNGDVINARLQHREGRLQRNIEQGQSSAEIVREFYLRGLGRLPDEREQQMWDEQLSTATGDELRRRLEDFVWAMLNSRDFSENH